MLTIALTGGIASGKTTVSDMFAELGAAVVDADLLAREAVAPGSPGLAKVAERFGEQVLAADGTLDRAALRKIVFSDEQARKDLEAIVHPAVRELTMAQIEHHRQRAANYCLVVIPLLAESGRHKQYDHVLVVDVDEQTQLNRLLQRDGNSEAQSRRMIASQASREQRLAIADFIIENHADNSLAELRQQVEMLHRQWSAAS